jgi:hypothetical protein
MSDDLRGNAIVMPVILGGRESSDPVCTENLNAGVVVVKSAKEGV